MDKTFELNDPALRAHNPFRVPEGYFEQLTDAVMQRIHAAAVPAPAPRELPIVRWLPWLGAACVAGLLCLFAATGHLSGAAESSPVASDYEEAAYDYYVSTADADNLAYYDATDY